jgi:hypothetical protein
MQRYASGYIAFKMFGNHKQYRPAVEGADLKDPVNSRQIFNGLEPDVDYRALRGYYRSFCPLIIGHARLPVF